MKFNKEALKKYIWEFIDWMMFFVFIILTYVFVIDVWQDYANGRSAMSHETRPIPKQPTVSLCFGHPLRDLWHRPMYNLHSDINITYYKIWYSNKTADPQSIILKEGRNNPTGFGDEVIEVEKWYNCYSISTVPSENHYQHEQRVMRLLKMEYNNNLDFMKLYPEPIFFSLTSKKNSYGAERRLFIEGEVEMFKVPMEFYGGVELSPKVTKLLKEKSGCRNESFWELFEPEFVRGVAEKCGDNACSPIRLPSKSLRACENEAEWNCANLEFRKKFRKMSSADSAPCSKIEYFGIQKVYDNVLQLQTWTNVCYTGSTNN